MIKRHNRQRSNRVFYRVNERIFAHTLRVLDGSGKQIGVLSKFEALTKAREAGLDLVEIAPNAKPPVAKIIDFKKFLYQQEKKKREEKKKSKVSETKEIRLGPFMNVHDINVMVKRGREFLEDNDKIRLVVKFRGREITHPEFGRGVLDKVMGALFDISKMEREPRFEGKQLIVILSPERKVRPKADRPLDEKTDENKEISNKKV